MQPDALVSLGAHPNMLVWRFSYFVLLYHCNARLSHAPPIAIASEDLFCRHQTQKTPGQGRAGGTRSGVVGKTPRGNNLSIAQFAISLQVVYAEIIRWAGKTLATVAGSLLSGHQGTFQSRTEDLIGNSGSAGMDRRK